MDPQLVQIGEMAIALAMAIIAYWQNRQKNRAENEARQVAAFFDPKDETVTVPPPSVPARSWTMGEETRRWVLAGHDAQNQAGLLRQIGEAEEKRLSHYYLTFQDRGGGYYEIEYGLIKGSGVGKAEK
jgi:hypothetical protein